MAIHPSEDLSTNRLLAYFFLSRMQTRLHLGMTRDEAWMDTLKSYLPVLVRPKTDGGKGEAAQARPLNHL